MVDPNTTGIKLLDILTRLDGQEIRTNRLKTENQRF